VRDPGMPFRWNLGDVIMVLGVVDPSLTTRDFFFRVIVLEILVAELVRANESPRLGVTDILQLPPPCPNPHAVYAPQIPL